MCVFFAPTYEVYKLYVILPAITLSRNERTVCMSISNKSYCLRLYVWTVVVSFTSLVHCTRYQPKQSTHDAGLVTKTLKTRHALLLSSLSAKLGSDIFWVPRWHVEEVLSAERRRPPARELRRASSFSRPCILVCRAAERYDW